MSNKYLEDLLASQRLDETSDEWKALDAEAVKIEGILRAAYPNSVLMFTHGGSRAKHTMIREDYDLDEVNYFQNADTAAGETLEEIYESVAGVLAKHYTVRRKRSALRLSMKDGRDIKVDVAPGRYVDNTLTDVFIHQNEGSKERLKTNIVKHIEHVRDSGCTDVVMLGKLWRTRNGIGVKTFPLELLVIVVLRRERIDVRALVADEISRRQDLAVELTPETAGEMSIEGDPVALRRALSNLIDNARRYGSRCRVVVQSADKMIAILVEDDGPGVPEAEREAVFEPFYRLETSRSRTTGGSGLGLAIARQIAEAHGGTIQVEQSSLGGLRAELRLPTSGLG